MESWLRPYLNRPVSEFVASYGPPTTVYEEGDGRKVYVWSRGRQRQAPGMVQDHDYGQGVRTQTVYPGATRQWNEYEMAVVENGMVVEWKWGNQ